MHGNYPNTYAHNSPVAINGLVLQSDPKLVGTVLCPEIGSTAGRVIDSFVFRRHHNGSKGSETHYNGRIVYFCIYVDYRNKMKCLVS